MTVRSVSSPRAETLRPRRPTACGWPAAAVLLAGSVATALVTGRVAAEAPTSFAIRKRASCPSPARPSTTARSSSRRLHHRDRRGHRGPSGCVGDRRQGTHRLSGPDRRPDRPRPDVTPAPSRAGPPASPDSPRPASARGPEDRPASTPWVQAADDVKVDERRFESWRADGFTTALTAPRSGIFPGQGAVINLAGERPGDLVVRAPVTLQVNFRPPAASAASRDR